jgi:phosphopantetheinyl transferase
MLFFHADACCLRAVRPVTESEEELLALLPHPDRYREEVSHFTATERRRERLAVRLLLHELLPDNTPQIAYYESGKPYLTESPHTISISHTRGYVAVIIGLQGQEVGIDIEQYSLRVHRLASRYMHPDELVAADGGTDTWSLLLHWSAKETLFKCLNTDEVDFREHLHILPFTRSEQGTLQAFETRTPDRLHFTIGYQLHPDFVLTFSQCPD